MPRRRALNPNFHLPIDLCAEIISRLPVDSILRFRCVSKSWRALIDDPSFVHTHLARFRIKRPQPDILIAEGKFREERCVVRSSENFKKLLKLGSLESSEMCRHTFGSITDHCRIGDWMFVCSIDGIIVLSGSDTDLMMWNPSIRRSRMLPHAPEIPSGTKYFEMGLGLDPSISDYKYVRFVWTIDGANDPRIPRSVAIYTLGTNSWKTIPFESKAYFRFCSHACTYFKGALYLVAWNENGGPKFLVSFDLSSEVFAYIKLMPVDDDLKHYYEKLTVADNGRSLAVVYMEHKRGSLWVLENSFGDDIESMNWRKLCTFSDPNSNRTSCQFLYLKKNNDILLSWSNAVTLYSVEAHSLGHVMTKATSRDYGDGHDHIESLILLN